MTRGEHLFNPLNIMEAPGTTWCGQKKPTADPEKRLAQFIDYEHGVRAGAIILRRYANDYNCKTVKLIITRWAPPSENPTNDYIDFIAKYCGVGPSDILNLNDDSFLGILIDGLIRFEQGADVCTVKQVADGIAMSHDPKLAAVPPEPEPATPVA